MSWAFISNMQKCTVFFFQDHFSLHCTVPTATIHALRICNAILRLPVPTRSIDAHCFCPPRLLSQPNPPETSAPAISNPMADCHRVGHKGNQTSNKGLSPESLKFACKTPMPNQARATSTRKKSAISTLSTPSLKLENGERLSAWLASNGLLSSGREGDAPCLLRMRSMSAFKISDMLSSSCGAARDKCNG